MVRPPTSEEVAAMFAIAVASCVFIGAFVIVLHFVIKYW